MQASSLAITGRSYPLRLSLPDSSKTSVGQNSMQMPHPLHKSSLTSTNTEPGLIFLLNLCHPSQPLLVSHVKAWLGRIRFKSRPQYSNMPGNFQSAFFGPPDRANLATSPLFQPASVTPSKSLHLGLYCVGTDSDHETEAAIDDQIKGGHDKHPAYPRYRLLIAGLNREPEPGNY